MRRLAVPALAAVVVLASVAVVVFRVDLSPKVESDFFFATDDPQLQASRQIGELFPAAPQILIAATGEDVFADDYLERLGELTDELAAIDGVADVKSLTRGPPSPASVPDSPVWSRLLLGDDPHVTLLIAELDANRGDGDGDRELVAAVEAAVERHDSPAFSLRISGVPYAVELIRRHLERDLRRFSTAAIAVFGLVIALIYRSLTIVAGALVTCLGACATTLATLHLAGSSIGLLTANIVTIVFVLTLSHLVFLTANWRRAVAADDDDGDPAERAVRATFTASFWCMATTLLGFASLLLASARPLRELGFAGAVGAAVAIAVAYGLYPTVLRWVPATGRAARRPHRPFPFEPGAAGVAVAVALTAIAAFGLPRIDTDPTLLSYFAEGSELRAGLERIDRSGGSSPLLVVVSDPDGRRLDRPAVLERLGEAQNHLDADPAVGAALSLPVLVAEARRAPLAGFLPPAQLIDLLDSPRYDRVASTFVTEDRLRGLFFLRMREAERDEPRRRVIDRLAGRVTEQGLEVELVGGLYDLQGRLGALVGRSLLTGLSALFALFLGIAAVVSRSARTTAAMAASLAMVPVLLLGTFGLLRLPLDVVTSPAANVAVALGIDSMIHLATAVRRRRRAGDDEATAWRTARDRLWQPIAGAMLILAAGFGIFGLSSFPPTARFGLAIAGGTLAAGAIALTVLPRLATFVRDDGV